MLPTLNPIHTDMCLNRHGGNQQSNEAYESLKGDAPQLRAKVWRFVQQKGAEGATCFEVSQALDMLYPTASARITELKARGALIDSGNRRKTPSGRNAAVLVTNVPVTVKEYSPDLYAKFLAKKKVDAPAVGFEAKSINPKLFDWQQEAVSWALQQGRAALWEDCGLGKTFQQLEWGREVCNHTNRNVLIAAPLAVNSQTVAEGEKLGIEVHSVRSQDEVKPGINITNYEMIEAFDPSQFGGVVLDESSILKSFMGKTKRYLVEAFAATPYKLACTATPSPNDTMEIGNHSDFLSVMPSSEMLARWFINDTMKMGTYRLKGHGEADFWQWVASWAVSMRRPSDLGNYSDEGYVLPPLNMQQVCVDVDDQQETNGALFRMPTLSATTIHKEMRLTCEARASMARDIISQKSNEAHVVWCNTNYEADALKLLLPDAVEVRGSDSVKEKERKLTAFSNGDERIIITKPSIAGFGLNWQHCNNAVFVGLSYSFEQFYQALRRNYRFGQTQQVNATIVTARTEGAILQSLHEKMAAHETMMDGLVTGRRNAKRGHLRLIEGGGDVQVKLPEWLKAA